MAERVGFEPTVRFPARSLSRRVLSTAQPPLRVWRIVARACVGRTKVRRPQEMRGYCPLIVTEARVAPQSPRRTSVRIRVWRLDLLFREIAREGQQAGVFVLRIDII